jgi:hypothetical protein
MTDNQDCLAHFAVAAGIGGDAAKPAAIDAIDAYIAAGPDEPQAVRDRLFALRDAYDRLQNHSSLTIIIKDALSRRIEACDQP